MADDYDEETTRALQGLQITSRIIRNRIRCRKCDDTIESHDTHDSEAETAAAFS